LFASAASADDSAADSQETAQAREEFVRGADFVKKAQWAEALAAFERSAKLRPHPVTTYNIGACQRALGRYALSRKTLRAALAEHEAGHGAQLPESVLTELKGYLEQIDGLLASADVTLDPPTASIAVDGRPLEAEPGVSVVMVAGIRAPGPGEAPPTARFRLVLDPGAHVITLSRKGYADAVVNRTFLPRASITLPLVLDRLPATLHIGSNREGAVVAVNGLDVGVAPVDVSRPAGTYHVVVRRDDFVTYETQVAVKAGEESSLRATLEPRVTPLTKKWWFWTIAGVVVTSAAVTTYALTRPDPQAPPYNRGSRDLLIEFK
jgi:hypothetical protein